MKFKTLLIFFFIASCVTGNYSKSSFQPYDSKGFVLIYEDADLLNKIVSKKLDSSKLQIAHKYLKRNTLLVLTNPDNKKSIELKVSKKTEYPNFFKLLITKKVAKELELDSEFPYLEINQRVENRSFIAKKAKIFSEERNVLEKVPVTKIKIDNISNNDQKFESNRNVKKIKKFKILIGEFYSKKTALNLQSILGKNYVDKKLLNIEKLGKGTFALTAGPYISINTLKSDYFELNRYGFEDLDIKQND